jgi:S-adenosylmethionine:tRNA ribosyltransferase-isomerase
MYRGARMETARLEYELPPELIAQHPAERRDESRLLVFERATGEVRHRRFSELPQELRRELLVVNETRVIPARLRLRRPGGGEAEVLLLEPLGDGVWEGLARPSRRLRPGMRLGPVELLEPLGEGRWRLLLEGEPAGETPLPPYITEPLDDPERYQTVYAREQG